MTDVFDITQRLDVPFLSALCERPDAHDGVVTDCHVAAN
jgi:hypothetical protein